MEGDFCKKTEITDVGLYKHSQTTYVGILSSGGLNVSNQGPLPLSFTQILLYALMETVLSCTFLS